MRMLAGFFATLPALAISAGVGLCCVPTSDIRTSLLLLEQSVRDIFAERPHELQARGSVPAAFVAALDGVALRICQSNTFDFRTDGQTIYVDVELLDRLILTAIALRDGQYLVNNSGQGTPFDLVEAFLLSSIGKGRYAGVSNYDELLDAFSGGSPDAFQPPMGRDPTNDLAGILVHAIGFLMLHEQCHIFLGHPGKNIGWNAANDIEAMHTAEAEADSCAIEIVNKDEIATGGKTGANAIGAFVALGTSLVLDEVLKRELGDQYRSSHPSTRLRIKSVTDLAIRDLERLPEDDQGRIISIATLEALAQFASELNSYSD